MGRAPVSRAVKSDTSAMKYVMSDPALVLDENDKWQLQWDRLLIGK